jgi:phosphoribosylformimino-5-aminoimidazole carboxamide ribotide isomerase
VVRGDEQMASHHRLRTHARYVQAISHGYSTPLTLGIESIALLEPYCSEFLIHAADVEGLQRGIDHELVSRLAEWCSIPVTYAGGGRSLEDLELVKQLSDGKVDLTIGSALDIFGGSGVKFEDCVKWNEEQEKGAA